MALNKLLLCFSKQVRVHCTALNKFLLCFSYNAWKADVWEGSHLVCQWSIGGELENGYTTVLQVRTGSGECL